MTCKYKPDCWHEECRASDDKKEKPLCFIPRKWNGSEKGSEELKSLRGKKKENKEK